MRENPVEQAGLSFCPAWQVVLYLRLSAGATNFWRKHGYSHGAV